jgi:hypothetical protein
MIEKHAINRGNDKTIDVDLENMNVGTRFFTFDQLIGRLLMRYLAKIHENRIN